MDISNMKEEIKEILYSYAKQINAYNLMLEKFCRKNLFHERCENKELNLRCDGTLKNMVHVHFSSGDDHICPCNLLKNNKTSRKQQKEMPTYETDPGTYTKPIDCRELKGI